MCCEDPCSLDIKNAACMQILRHLDADRHLSARPQPVVDLPVFACTAVTGPARLLHSLRTLAPPGPVYGAKPIFVRSHLSFYSVVHDMGLITPQTLQASLRTAHAPPGHWSSGA